MFWTRSDYFRALIDDHFHEGSWDAQTSRATIPINHVNPDIFAIVVSHVYSNRQQVIQKQKFFVFSLPLYFIY
jgi:hypothetical protein